MILKLKRKARIMTDKLRNINITKDQINEIFPNSYLSAITHFMENEGGDGLIYIPYNDFKLSSENTAEAFLIEESFYLAQYIAIKSTDPSENLFWKGKVLAIENAIFNDMHEVVKNGGFSSKLKHPEMVSIVLKCKITKSGKNRSAKVSGFFGNHEIFSVAFSFEIITKDQFTLSIVKPDAVSGGHTSQILEILKNNNLRIATVNIHGINSALSKRMRLTDAQVQEFYGIHKKQPFFKQLCDFMTSGDCVVSVICGKNAVEVYRQIMGATNPSNAQEGTIRKLYATSIDHNAVHGSDSVENAKIEIEQMFPGYYKKYLRHGE